MLGATQAKNGNTKLYWGSSGCQAEAWWMRWKHRVLMSRLCFHRFKCRWSLEKWNFPLGREREAWVLLERMGNCQSRKQTNSYTSHSQKSQESLPGRQGWLIFNHLSTHQDTSILQTAKLNTKSNFSPCSLLWWLNC